MLDIGFKSTVTPLALSIGDNLWHDWFASIMKATLLHLCEDDEVVFALPRFADPLISGLREEMIRDPSAIGTAYASSSSFSPLSK